MDGHQLREELQNPAYRPARRHSLGRWVEMPSDLGIDYRLLPAGTDCYRTC